MIQERKGVSVGTLSGWVHEFGNACMSPEEIARGLNLDKKNKWSGILLLDGKYIKKDCILLLAVDYITLDIVAWVVVDKETEENYSKLVDLVEQAGYVIQALISDGHAAIHALTKPKRPTFIRKTIRGYPSLGKEPAKQRRARLEGIPHQWCVVHADRELEREIRKAEKRSGEKYDELKRFMKDILFAKTENRAARVKKQLLVRTYENNESIYKYVASWLLERWDLLMIHHTVRINRRKIPRDSNTVENIISYVNIRLKTMRKLRTTKSAIPITNLIVLNYRTKPLKNTKNKLKRGKSPLALAVGENKRFDWITFIKKSTA